MNWQNIHKTVLKWQLRFNLFFIILSYDIESNIYAHV